VDLAQLSGQGGGAPAQNAAQVCEIPNQTVVDIPVPAAGERVLVDAHPGEALRLACEFKDVKGAEVGHDLELTFPSGGVAVIENFDQWVLAKGATVTDCKCGGMNLADFVVALGLNPEDVLPAAGGQTGGAQGGRHPPFALTPSDDLPCGLAHPHVRPPTAAGYAPPDSADV